MKTENNKMNGEHLLFGAHRGDRTNYPENTMEAMKAAVAVGCDMVETDVRMSKDGQLVLMHDRSVERTTNGTGFVDEMTLEELKALDAGAWKGEKFTGSRIPTVEELLAWASQTQVLVDWELKEYTVEVGRERAFRCVDKLVELIELYGMVERSRINSFSDKLLEYVDTTWPGKFVLNGYLRYHPSKDVPSEKPIEDFVHWSAIWDRSAEFSVGKQEDYDYARDKDILACILVADEEENYRKALQAGCRMLVSDNPGKGIELLRRLGER